MATKGRGKNWSVLHTLLDTSHPEEGPTSQTFYLSTTPIMGFQPRTFWVHGVSGTQKFNEIQVVVPASDNAAISSWSRESSARIAKSFANGRSSVSHNVPWPENSCDWCRYAKSFPRARTT